MTSRSPTASTEPGWTRRLAQLLAAKADAVCAPARVRLRRAGIVPEALASAAVLAAIVETSESGPGILFTRRRDDLARHPGQVAFPGGEQDPEDAGPERTALREAQEEVGLAPEQVQVLGRLPRYPTVTGYLITPVVGYVARPPAWVPQPAEVAEIFTVPLAILLDPGRWRERPLEFEGERIPHRELIWEGRRIWGATAGMLRLLLPPLGRAYGSGG